MSKFGSKSNLECGGVTLLSFAFSFLQRSKTKNRETKESGVTPPHSKLDAGATRNTFHLTRPGAIGKSDNSDHSEVRSMPRDYDDDEPRPRRRPRRDDDDDDDRPPPRRKVRRYVDDDEDEPRPRRKKSRPKQKQMNAVGAIALGIGVISLLISFIPCFASIALWPGIVGVVVGFIGLLISHNSDGRLGNGMPIAGMSVSTAAILIGVGWLVLGKKVEKEIERRGKDFQAEVAKEEAKRKDEVARAAKDVKDADPATVIRLTAFQFSKAFEDDGQGDRLYKNKVLEITGVVQRVDFGDDEDAYIVLLRAGPNEEDAVDCRFLKDPAVRAQLGQIQPGATVTIRGKCLGGDASLEACILVQ